MSNRRQSRHVHPWAFAACLLLAATALADSATVSYQGILRDGALAPVPNGNYEMTFSIWDAPTGGTMQWGEETHPTVAVIEGVFSVYLGSIEAFDTEFSDFTALWLESTADTGAGPETYALRVPLASVPLASVPSERHQIDLYDVGAGSHVIAGTSERSANNDATTTYSVLDGRLELSSTTTFQIRHHMTLEKSSNGLGLQSNTPGVQNVYTVVRINKF